MVASGKANNHLASDPPGTKEIGNQGITIISCIFISIEELEHQGGDRRMIKTARENESPNQTAFWAAAPEGTGGDASPVQ